MNKNEELEVHPVVGPAENFLCGDYFEYQGKGWICTINDWGIKVWRPPNVDGLITTIDINKFLDKKNERYTLKPDGTWGKMEL